MDSKSYLYNIGIGFLCKKMEKTISVNCFKCLWRSNDSGHVSLRFLIPWNAATGNKSTVQIWAQGNAATSFRCRCSLLCCGGCSVLWRWCACDKRSGLLVYRRPKLLNYSGNTTQAQQLAQFAGYLLSWQAAHDCSKHNKPQDPSWPSISARTLVFKVLF